MTEAKRNKADPAGIVCGEYGHVEGTVTVGELNEVDSHAESSHCKYGPKVAVLGTLGYEPTVQLSRVG